ncbi:Glyoxylase, beta-lactamase superfamily II [Duganella sp. CF402]|uniref:MBL fold metallo-hydrolase n=1 Tax=unclassified Duganella TaxID=2636909 RepID=UPI0008B961B7|nr:MULTISPECIES: MBL fold metallo-hydrolase [unclassified Duganella]RZT09943.1 glyoxylase-like metal-dependent hydrolase (beta-lactamase superfamily II) [Duganella sp. BK701]SEL35979.1 Glyoxylase, beta-lactamase superfamily II [Duganella sp. CF402]
MKTALIRTAAAIAICALVGASHAAAPMSHTPAAGFYRTTLGQYEITALSDGTHPFPVDTVMTNISQQQALQDLAEADLALPLQGSINAFLINTGSKLILIDTGAGALYGDCCGKLVAHMRAAGYQPEQVDEIYITHLHKDHAGGVAAFPNAVLRLSQAEADYWLTPANRAKAPAFLSTFFDAAQAAVAPYQAAGRFRPFKDFGPLEAGIEAVPAPGHTPGHASYLIQSAGQQLLVWGDIVHVAPVQLAHPVATVKYDSSEANAQTTRVQLLRQAAEQHWIIGAAHIAFPGLGHIRRRQGEYQWLPLNYDETP